MEDGYRAQSLLLAMRKPSPGIYLKYVLRKLSSDSHQNKALPENGYDVMERRLENNTEITVLHTFAYLLALGLVK